MADAGVRESLLRGFGRSRLLRVRYPRLGVSALLIDRFLPVYDATSIHHVVVDAPADVTFAAIPEADIGRDPVIRGLGFLRDLPNRVSRRRRGRPEPPPVRTFGDILGSSSGWVRLAEQPNVETVVGLVGRFWQRDYGVVRVTAEEFASFDAPGHAKVAVSFTLHPYGEGRTLLTYEARTQATDEEARRAFARYSRLIGPGAALLMRRALKAIKAEAERRAATRT